MLISSDATKIAEVIQQGGVIAYPTEAVFGLGCDPRNQQAVERLLEIKQRSMDKGLILIAAEFEQLSNYLIPLNSSLKNKVFATWPGPVTWLLPASSHTPNWITGKHSSIAVRISSHPACQQLCHAFAQPLISTSANPSQQLPAKTIQAVVGYFQDTVDAIFDAPIGEKAMPTEIRDGLSGRVVRES